MWTGKTNEEANRAIVGRMLRTGRLHRISDPPERHSNLKGRPLMGHVQRSYITKTTLDSDLKF